MKKSPIAFVMFFICGAYAATHLDTENRLWFNADVVKNAIVEFVPESKQQPVADLYQDLMDQTTGKISVDSLFKVCRKAGFNTYKYDGFTQCKSFIQKMLMDAEIAQSVDLNGFCPGLDEKGNNPNKLRSITDKTRIGDFCSSTNIRMGQVIFKPGYNCSCMASVCNPGFEFQGGACVTQIAGHSGNCPRHAHSINNQNNSLEKCQAFCEQKYSGNACQFMAVAYDDKQCICSPTDAEIDAAYNALQEKINNLDYYEVCKRKRNSGDVCDEDTFNWVNVGRLQASGLAEEYARVRYKDTIHCDTTNTRGTIDDYVKCSSLQQKKYYEFKFDDIKESVDSDIQAGVVLGICSIHNVKSNVVVAAIGDANRYTIAAVNNQIGVLGCKTACTSDITESARRMGLTATTEGKFCVLSGRSIKSKDTESKLAKIDGIDNYVFFHGIQIQGSQNIISQLRQYIKSTGKTVRTFDCNKNVGEIKNSLLAGDDDVLPCMLNGQPIDFVFEDFSESWLYVQEVGEGKIQCIVSGGKFAGQECYGLDEKQCTDANAKFLKQNPGASGFRWDGKECVSLDANEAQFYDGAIQVGTGTIALVDCVFGTKLGCVLVAVESASLVAEMGSGVAIENRAGDFLALATRCNDRNCAINILRNDASRVLSVKDVMDATSLNSVDQGLAHLVDKLEPEDLSGVSDGDWDAIVRQLGGDPEDAGGTALVMLNKIGLIGQFASVGASGLRLTAQAITKLAGRGSRIGRTASTVARALDTSGDAARAANATSDAARAANNTADALHANIDAVRNASNKNRARAMYHPDKYATSSASIQSKAQDIFQKLDNIDNMSDDELRALSRLMSEFDAEVAAEAAAKATAAAADATRATTNAATDGARTANATTDAGRGASGSGRATSGASDASKGGKAADNASKSSRVANLYEDWKVFGKGKESYEFDFDILGKNEKELTEFSEMVQKDGYLTRIVGKKIFVKDALSDLYKRAAAGERNVFARKGVLSPQRWEELNQSIAHLKLKYVDDTEIPGFMQLVRETPAKTGDELWESLKSRNWKGVRKNGFYYMFIDGASGGQHATGLKFHISVSPDDLDKATDVIGAAMKRSGIGGEFKVFLDPDDMTWMKQTGKEFTVYVSQDGYNSSKIQQFIRECEQGLRNSGVKTNGIGSNVSVGDRAVSGSQYIRYRYDQLDDLGRPQGFYRSKYDFVAPNAANGGDIMNGINATADAARTTSRATNATADAARTANATADAARTTSRTTNTATDGTRMFGRTNLDDIGMVNKGWERAVFDGVDRFRHKKITYPEEADDVRRALEATKGQHNLAYMGVKDGYIVIAYESDLERAWPAFNKAVSGMTDAARTTSRATYSSLDELAATPLQRAKGKLYTYGQTFDKTIDDFLYRNGGYPASWRRADLTDAEFDALRTDLHSRGLLLDTDPQGYLHISRISNTTADATRTTSHATNATADASRTVNNVTETNTGKSSVFTRSQFFSILGDADKKIIKEFSTDPRPLGRGGLEFRALEAVNGEIASLFPDEIVYYDRFSSNVHTKDLSKALWSSIQIPEKNLDEFIDVILVAQEYNKASIPIATDGHVFTLIKNNDEWAIIDQFGRNRYTSPKSIIKEVLLEAGVPENKILETMENLPKVAENRLDCYAYSSQVSFNNLTESATAKDYASGYFDHDATDRHIQIMQQAAEMLVDVMGK